MKYALIILLFCFSTYGMENLNTKENYLPLYKDIKNISKEKLGWGGNNINSEDTVFDINQTEPFQSHPFHDTGLEIEGENGLFYKVYENKNNDCFVFINNPQKKYLTVAIVDMNTVEIKSEAPDYFPLYHNDD